MKKSKIFIDMSHKNVQHLAPLFSLNINRKVSKKVKSTLLSRGKRMDKFFTEDSGLYITPKQHEMIGKGISFEERGLNFDSISSKIVRDYKSYSPSRTSFLAKSLARRYELLKNNTLLASDNITKSFSTVRLWNLSIVGAILFGMFSMTMIYRYLGQGASAVGASVPAVQESSQESNQYGYDDDLLYYTQKAKENLKSEKKEELEEEIMKMVEGYPIEDMVEYIAEKDRTVAAFLIGIGKKESNWGKRVPVLNGQDCYNYWGYRGIRKLMGTGGHTCFNSRKDAVDTVAKRLETLIDEYGRNTPEEMVVWKCGSSCAATGGQAAANKWISDVDMYFKELN